MLNKMIYYVNVPMMAAREIMHEMNKTWADLSVVIVGYPVCQEQSPMLHPYWGFMGTVQAHSGRSMTQDAFHHRRYINLFSLGSSSLRKLIFPCTHVFLPGSPSMFYPLCHNIPNNINVTDVERYWTRAHRIKRSYVYPLTP